MLNCGKHLAAMTVVKTMNGIKRSAFSVPNLVHSLFRVAIEALLCAYYYRLRLPKPQIKKEKSLKCKASKAYIPALGKTEFDILKVSYKLMIGCVLRGYRPLDDLVWAPV